MTNPSPGGSPAEGPPPTRPRTPLRPLVLVLPLAALVGACSAHTDSAPATTPLAPVFTAPPSAPAEKVPTVESVLAALKPAGATNPLPTTPETDKNNMLGRPGGYTARVAFELPGGDPTAEVGSIERGGGFEIWPDTAAAKRRYDYIQGILAAAPILGTEYDYLAGPVFVRVTGKVTPANAKKIEEAVKGLPQ